MATYVKWLKGVGSSDEQAVGKKAAALGELYNAGFPVPNGFVILQSAFQDNKLADEAKEEIEAAYSMLDANHELHGIKLARLIGVGRELPFVSARGSGRAIQNIKGNNNLLHAIKELQEKHPSPVIVQKQINSEKSGTTSARGNEITVSAIYGLDGIMPVDKSTSYIVNKQTGKFSTLRFMQDFFVMRDEFDRVIKRNLNDAQKNSQTLNEPELDVLARLAQKVESHCKAPQKISWAIERGKVFLLQAEPSGKNEQAKPQLETGVSYDLGDDSLAGLSFVLKGETPQKTNPEESNQSREKISTRTKIFANASTIAEAEAAAKCADGIGLLKVHKVNAKRKTNVHSYVRGNKINEYEGAIYDGLREVLSHAEGRPTTIRVSNMQELLSPEFSAIRKLYEDGFTNLNIALPLVVSVDEVKKAKEMLRETWFGDKAAVALPISLGVCVETPAAALIIEHLCREGIDFAHIDTDNLAKTILIASRKNLKPDAQHPAVLRAIEHVIKACKSHKVIVSAGISDSTALERLVSLGIDSVSVSPNLISDTRKKISELETSEL